VSYMAPEQVNGDGLDRRADVFALGIVLYALTTGKHPFRRESEAGTMFAICSPDPVVPPSKVVAEYPPELELIVLKALEKDRDKRFMTCDEMLRALDSLPSHLRASSDADVAEFVTRLMGERRTEQRQRLEAALARAEEGGLLPSNDGQGWNGRPAFGTGSQEVSGIPEAVSHGSRNRLIGVAGLVALVLSGGILVQAIRSRADAPREVRVIEVQEPQKPAPVVEPSKTLPQIEEETKEPEAKELPQTPRPQKVRPPAPKPEPTTPTPGSWRDGPGF
jgi:eukaryotic-like serine/threonine-protein kinase